MNLGNRGMLDALLDQYHGGNRAWLEGIATGTEAVR